MKKWKKKWYIAGGLFIIPWIFWWYAIANASNAGFMEDMYALQIMILGGAIAMVIGAYAGFFRD